MGWNELSDPDMRTANFEFSCDVYREGVYTRCNEQWALQENQSKITANQNSMWAEYLCGKHTEFATTEQNIIQNLR